MFLPHLLFPILVVLKIGIEPKLVVLKLDIELKDGTIAQSTTKPSI